LQNARHKTKDKMRQMAGDRPLLILVKTQESLECVSASAWAVQFERVSGWRIKLSGVKTRRYITVQATRVLS